MFLTLLETGLPFDGKDGKTYHLNPLNLQDLADFVQWVKFLPYHRAKATGAYEHDELKAIRDECATGKVKEEVAEGKFEEFDISIDSSVVRDEMVSLDGIIKLLQISLHKSHPGVNILDVCDDETLEFIQKEVLKATGLMNDSEKN